MKTFPMFITGVFDRKLQCISCKYQAETVNEAHQHYLQKTYLDKLNGVAPKHDFRWTSQV